MVKVDFQRYSDYMYFAKDCKCGKVYPLSIAGQYQQGDILINSSSNCNAALFWHYSGFAFLLGEYDEGFLKAVYDIVIDENKINSRRFILFSNEKYIENYFSDKENVDIERRYFFEYKSQNCNVNYDLPHNCELKVIDSGLLSEIEGRITPYFSWDNSEEFLTKGKGYCIISDGNIAAWAFSAAISDDEIDIGVETNERYQHRGFGAIASKAMIQYILEKNKIPVWACHYKNTASAQLARKIGFDKIGECAVIKRKGT